MKIVRGGPLVEIPAPGQLTASRSANTFGTKANDRRKQYSCLGGNSDSDDTVYCILARSYFILLCLLHIQRFVHPLSSLSSLFLTPLYTIHQRLKCFSLLAPALSSLSASGSVDCLSAFRTPARPSRASSAEGTHALLERYTWPARFTDWEAACDAEEGGIRALFAREFASLFGGGERGL